VRLEEAANYYGLDIRISFDPAVVQVPAGRVTPLWGVFDAVSHFPIKNQADNVSGTVWYAVTNMNPAPPFTGTGAVCAIAFAAQAPGQADLQFTYAKGASRDGEALFPQRLGAQIMVRAPERYAILLPLCLRAFREGE